MIGISLNNVPALDPVVVNENIQLIKTKRDSQWVDIAGRSQLAALCNRFADIAGPRPSYGYFAMTRKAINSLTNRDITLRMVVDGTGDIVERAGLVMVNATSLVPISTLTGGSDGQIFVVEVADKRYYGNHPWMRLDSQGQKMFNVINPVYGQDQYYIDSMDGELGAGLELPWSWQTMFDELWPTYMGDSPVLNYIPEQYPTNMDFRAFTNYQAIQIILGMLNLSLYSRSDGSFATMNTGNNDTNSFNNNLLRRKYAASLDEKVEWIEPTYTYYPKGVKVHFQRTATNSGSENVFTNETGQWYTDMEHIITVDAVASDIDVSRSLNKMIDGTYHQIWDDMPAWTDPYSGDITNLSDLETRARERKDNFYQNLAIDRYRLHEVWSQLVPFKICGTTQAVLWSQCLRRGGAFITEIFFHPRKSMEVCGGTLTPALIQPDAPWQWRSAPVYPPETMLWRNDGLLTSGSSTGTQDDEYNGVEIRYNPLTKTYEEGIYVKGVPTPG